MMRLRINGIEEEVAAATLAELLTARGVDAKARFLAVAVNGAVVRRAEWPAQTAGAGRRCRDRPPVLWRLMFYE